MKSIIFSILLFSFLSLPTHGQDQNNTNYYQQLLDVATMANQNIFSVKPLSTSRMNTIDLEEYFEILRHEKISVDSAFITDLYNDKIGFDNTHWSDIELKNSLMLKTGNEILKYCDSGVFQLSRPRFSISKEYAVIEYWKMDCEGFVKGGLRLFRYADFQWKEISQLIRWQTFRCRPTQLSE